MKDVPPSPAPGYDAEESEDLLGLVRDLIDGTHPGILTTVDPEGRPHARWMSSLALDALPYLYTLTDAHSRKLAHLAAHPEVEWLFSNADLSLVVSLSGRADVQDDPAALKEAWKHIRDKRHAYFLRNCTEGPGFVVVRTRVARVEVTTPATSRHFEVPTGLLSPS